MTSANENYRNIFSVFDNTTAKIAVKGNYEDYGLQIDCQYVFYCPRNSDITVGAYLITDTKTYEVTYVADWNMGLQVMLKGVKLNGRRK